MVCLAQGIFPDTLISSSDCFHVFRHSKERKTPGVLLSLFWKPRAFFQQSIDLSTNSIRVIKSNLISFEKLGHSPRAIRKVHSFKGDWMRTFRTRQPFNLHSSTLATSPKGILSSSQTGPQTVPTVISKFLLMLFLLSKIHLVVDLDSGYMSVGTRVVSGFGTRAKLQ